MPESLGVPKQPESQAANSTSEASPSSASLGRQLSSKAWKKHVWHNGPAMPESLQQTSGDIVPQEGEVLLPSITPLIERYLKVIVLWAQFRSTGFGCTSWPGSSTHSLMSHNWLLTLDFDLLCIEGLLLLSSITPVIERYVEVTVHAVH